MQGRTDAPAAVDGHLDGRHVARFREGARGNGKWAMRARVAQDYSSARHADVAARETHLFDQCVAAAARARRVGGCGAASRRGARAGSEGHQTGRAPTAAKPRALAALAWERGAAQRGEAPMRSLDGLAEVLDSSYSS